MASFSVVTNIAASAAQKNLTSNSVSLNRTLNRLSSGYRINNSGDDAAGLAVANGYRTQQAVLNQGVRNANDGLSTLQIKDGALNNISNLLDRLSTLATEASSSAFTGSTDTLNNEAQEIIKEIGREATIAGLGAEAGFSVYVGTGSSAAGSSSATVGGTIGAVTTDAVSSGLFGANTISLATSVSAASAVDLIASAVSQLGTVQGQVGTLENRLQYAISLAESQQTNIQAAESRIRDANIAQESANMTKHSILNQSGIAALAQANQQSSAVLSLLQG